MSSDQISSSAIFMIHMVGRTEYCMIPVSTLSQSTTPADGHDRVGFAVEKSEVRSLSFRSSARILMPEFVFSSQYSHSRLLRLRKVLRTKTAVVSRHSIRAAVVALSIASSLFGFNVLVSIKKAQNAADGSQGVDLAGSAFGFLFLWWH